MTRVTSTLAVVALGLTLLLPGSARADLPAAANAGTPEAVAEAKVHFTKGRNLYQAGSYHEAIAELEAARALDPKAKDLVFNLGVIHEKLGNITDALRFLRLYAQMDLEPSEQTRAENYIKRLEGAKAELDAKQAAERAAAEATPPPKATPTRGRLDTATLVAGGVAVVALAAGTVLGVKALGDQPGSGYVVGKNGTLAGLDSQQSSAHTEAIAADACFGGAVAAAAVAVGLYFGRYKDSPESPASRKKPSAFFSLAPLVSFGVPSGVRSGSGGELLLGGTF
jgi:tetratricopeptide (TPR) repeat protein